MGRAKLHRWWRLRRARVWGASRGLWASLVGRPGRVSWRGGGVFVGLSGAGWGASRVLWASLVVRPGRVSWRARVSLLELSGQVALPAVGPATGRHRE